MSDAVCWLNGAFMPCDQVRIDPADRGWTLGDGIFETIAVRNGTPAHLSAHLSRLVAGAAVLGLRSAWDRATIADAAIAVAGHAGLGAGSLRITWTRGPGRRGVLPDQAAHGTVLVSCTGAAPVVDTVRAIVCRTTCRNEKSPLCGVKSLNYGDGVLARIEAEEAGADDAVLLNTVGAVAEACAANLFALFDDKLLTPPVIDGALPGIIRALLLSRGQAEEATLSPDELLRATALFLTNSLGIRQVVALDGTAFSPAPELLRRLRALTAD